MGQIRHLNEQLHEQLARLEILQTRDESHSVSSARGTAAQIIDYYTTTLHSEEEFLATEDIQSEFTSIKDALTKVKLPADFRLCNSWQGIWWSDQSTYNIVSRCTWYAETSIRLLSLITEENLDDDSVQQLFAIQLAQIRYLQEEYSALVVQASSTSQWPILFQVSTIFSAQHLWIFSSHAFVVWGLVNDKRFLCWELVQSFKCMVHNWDSVACVRVDWLWRPHPFS